MRDYNDPFDFEPDSPEPQPPSQSRRLRFVETTLGLLDKMENTSMKRMAVYVGAAALAFSVGTDAALVEFSGPYHEAVATQPARPGNPKETTTPGKPSRPKKVTYPGQVSQSQFNKIVKADEEKTSERERLAAEMPQGYKVYDKPFKSPKAYPNTPANEFNNQQAESAASTMVETFSNNFIEAIELENGMKINIYDYQKDGWQLKVDPQGVVDMINYELTAIPSQQDSHYKKWGLEFLQKAKAKQLGNVEVDLLMSAVPNTCVETTPGFLFGGQVVGFSVGHGKEPYGVNMSCANHAVGLDVSVPNLTAHRADNYDVPVIVSRYHEQGVEPKEEELEDETVVTMHEFAHGIVTVEGNHTDPNQEHLQFVIPLSTDAAEDYEFAVSKGKAKQAFKYVKVTLPSHQTTVQRLNRAKRASTTP